MWLHLDTETVTRQPARQCHTAVGVDRWTGDHDTAARNVNHVRSACGGEVRIWRCYKRPLIVTQWPVKVVFTS